MKEVAKASANLYLQKSAGHRELNWGPPKLCTGAAYAAEKLCNASCLQRQRYLLRSQSFPSSQEGVFIYSPDGKQLGSPPSRAAFKSVVIR